MQSISLPDLPSEDGSFLVEFGPDWGECGRM